MMFSDLDSSILKEMARMDEILCEKRTEQKRLDFIKCMENAMFICISNNKSNRESKTRFNELIAGFEAAQKILRNIKCEA